ncbi:MAG: hypothetical protein KBT40_05185 [bacterium]|nr:hypothetical protein [Candidatus Minthenecus merdequi]
MNIKNLLDGYYAGSLTDSEEEQLEMLMISGHSEIPEEERKLYLGLANIPVKTKPVKKDKIVVWRISTVAASLALVLSLGYYIYTEQKRQITTQQEIFEMAMGNMSEALHRSDTTRQQLVFIINSINLDTATTENGNQNIEEI